MARHHLLLGARTVCQLPFPPSFIFGRRFIYSEPKNKKTAYCPTHTTPEMMMKSDTSTSLLLRQHTSVREGVTSHLDRPRITMGDPSGQLPLDSIMELLFSVTVASTPRVQFRLRRVVDFNCKEGWKILAGEKSASMPLSPEKACP